MRSLKIITCLMLLLYGDICAAKQKSPTQKALIWLQKSLKGYFSDSLTMDQLTTVRYASFKADAMNIDFDGGMILEAFEKKWNKIYNTKESYLHERFLIPLQDWVKVKIVCKPFLANKQVIWITVNFTEEPSHEHYTRYIKLVKENNSYRIDNVLAVMPKSGQDFITRDFDGDQQTDTLTVSFTSLLGGQSIKIDTALDYDTLIQTTVRQKPLLKLTSRSLPPLILNENNYYVLGLDYLKNIANINQKPGDEIAVIIQGADWSNSNICTIYSYSNDGWKNIKVIEIREEEDIPNIKSQKIKPWKK